MHEWEHVLYSIVRADKDFGSVLKTALGNLQMSVPEFSAHSGISESLLYKITSGHRENIHLSNFQKIVRSVRKLEQGRQDNERVIALISNRESLEHVREQMTVHGTNVRVRSYPSSTVEEAIRQSILAERDGVDAIVCGPITAYTVENIMNIPVIGLDVSNEQVKHAVELAVKKTTPVEHDR